MRLVRAGPQQSEAGATVVAGGLLAICVWRAKEHSPCHLAIAAPLTRHAGPAVVKRFQAPFAFGDADALRAVITGAGFRDVEVVVVMRHLLAPEVSIPGLLASTPVGPAVAALDAAVRRALVDEVAAALTAYRDRNGLTIPQATHIALSRK